MPAATANDSSTTGSQSWYIHDQRWSVLTAKYRNQDDVKRFCQARFYRITADGVPSDEHG